MNWIETKAWADAYISAQQDGELLKLGAAHPHWWAVQKAMFLDAETTIDERWEFILAVVAQSPGDEVIEMLAAGPLEDLIDHAGEEVIDRIEAEARRNPSFRDVLGGVWQSGTDDIWRRVEAARGKPW